MVCTYFNYVLLLYYWYELNYSLCFKFFENAGIVGFVLVAGYGLYKFKNHKGRTSLYLIQLRLAAQGTAVGIIGVGVLYNIYNESIKPKFKS